MKDRSSSRGSMHHIVKILKIGMSSAPEMPDEIFCQLVKQTNNNPDQKSALRAWKLFGICSGIIAPSAKLRYSLLNHLVTIEESESKDIAQRACYCIARLEKIYENGSRLVLPMVEEIKCMKDMKKFPAKVYSVSGNSIVMFVESFDNANDLQIAIVQRFGISISKFSLFGLYEIYEEDHYEERYIEKNELIMDLLSDWKTKGEFRLVLKLRIVLYTGIKDQILPFIYIQCAFDLLRCITLVSGKHFIILAALKLFIEKGKSMFLEGYLNSNLNFYVPRPYMKNASEENLAEKILKSYNKLPDMAKSQAQDKFIDIVSKYSLFGASIFYVQSQDTSEKFALPKEVMMSVSEKYIGIHTRDHRTELMKFQYEDIRSWGISKNRIALIAVINGYQIQFLFKTNQGKVISNLIQTFVNIKQGKTISNLSECDHSSRISGLSRDLAIKFPSLNMKVFK